MNTYNQENYLGSSNSNSRWNKLKEIIVESAEANIGYEKKGKNRQVTNKQLENMSEKQKNLRLIIQNSNDPEKIHQLKRERKSILKNMNKKVKEINERKAEEIIKEVEMIKDDNRMFKAIKMLYTKHSKIQFVHDDEEKCIAQPQEIYKIIEKHFKNHFNKSNVNNLKSFDKPAQSLKNKITTEEITKAVTKMSNNKAPGKDNINVELIKYAPIETHKEISNILNSIFENNDTSLNLGTGILLPIPKPKKIQGPVKNLRPITLLEIIRKILSKIFMNRTNEKIDKYLSQSQSAYRKSRGTTDIVWAYRWITAKTQEQDISIYITGIDMSSAFDTIYRDKIIEIAKDILDEDEIKILTVLLSDTTLEVKIEGAHTNAFTSNIGSPQGESISGPLFTIYLDNALHQLERAIQQEEILDVRDINPKWIEMTNSSLPNKMIYADDCDFLTEIEKNKINTYEHAKKVLPKNNLLMNDSKTEHTIIKRGKIEEETWRDVIKLGSKLGDKEDIKRRKTLSNIALRNNENVWKKKWLTTTKTRLRLYNTLVKSILLYNCGTWGLDVNDERNLNSFHRKQLRRVVGIKWPHRITNKKLYKITNSEPITITITERRWKLLGHILRLPANCPARKAMKYFFEYRSAKKFLGRKRTTIITTLNKDIKRTKQKFPSFPVVPLISQVSLQNTYTKAKNRKLWLKIVKQVVDSAYS